MNDSRVRTCGVLLALAAASCAHVRPGTAAGTVEFVGDPVPFAPNVVSTEFSEIRLTLSPDGRTAMWFSRNRPDGSGGYDIWISKQTAHGWSLAKPAPFNSAQRDFDPGFSSDGRHVYFCSDRPGGLGGDDIYRVAVTTDGYGRPEHLGPQVNSAGNEWAPMLSPDGISLLFSSNGRGGAGGFDLFAARRSARGEFELAVPLPGELNTAADEFDATFLSDNTTVVFGRARDLKVDTVSLFQAALRGGRYEKGVMLPASINATGKDTYGPMLDWSRPDQITFSGQRQEAQATDVYVVRYRLRKSKG